MIKVARRHRDEGCEAVADHVLSSVAHELVDDAALLTLHYSGPDARLPAPRANC